MSQHPLPLMLTNDPADLGDRRLTERKLCRVSGLLFTYGHAPISIKTIDISMDGIALLIPHALPERTICDLSFHLYLHGLLRQFSAKVEISNTVFLRSDVRSGCRFVSLDGESRKVLADYMRRSSIR
jgi:hypothetical protein